MNTTLDQVTKMHQTFLKNKGIPLKPEHADVPNIYWTPKLHKNPYEARFIAGSRKCTTKSLSVLLTQALKG